MLCLATSWLALPGLQSGCVIPAPLVQEKDAGLGSRPRILREILVPPLPEWDHSEAKGRVNFRIALQDPDSTQLTIRMFLDSNYTTRLPLSDEVKNVADVGKPVVLFTDLTGLCGELITDLETWHPLELWVSDAGFIPDPAETDAGGPSSPYMDLREPGPGGTRDGITWRVRCLPGGPTLDAGVPR